MPQKQGLKSAALVARVHSERGSWIVILPADLDFKSEASNNRLARVTGLWRISNGAHFLVREVVRSSISYRRVVQTALIPDIERSSNHPTSARVDPDRDRPAVLLDILEECMVDSRFIS